MHDEFDATCHDCILEQREQVEFLTFCAHHKEERARKGQQESQVLKLRQTSNLMVRNNEELMAHIAHLEAQLRVCCAVICTSLGGRGGSSFMLMALPKAGSNKSQYLTGTGTWSSDQTKAKRFPDWNAANDAAKTAPPWWEPFGG